MNPQQPTVKPQAPQSTTTSLNSGSKKIVTILYIYAALLVVAAGVIGSQNSRGAAYWVGAITPSAVLTALAGYFISENKSWAIWLLAIAGLAGVKFMPLVLVIDILLLVVGYLQLNRHKQA